MKTKISWVASSVVERCPDKTEVIGSIPMLPTLISSFSPRCPLKDRGRWFDSIHAHKFMLKPEVVYKEREFLVINKPAGLLVHKTTKFSDEATLVDWLLTNYPEVKGVGDDPKNRPGIVHRLDRATSGVMIIPRNQEYFEYLKNLFKEKRVKKTYLALVY